MTALTLRTIVAETRHDEHGQDLLEYAMLLALIVVVAIGMVGAVGATVRTVFWDVIAATFATV